MFIRRYFLNCWKLHVTIIWLNITFSWSRKCYDIILLSFVLFKICLSMILWRSTGRSIATYRRSTEEFRQNSCPWSIFHPFRSRVSSNKRLCTYFGSIQLETFAERKLFTGCVLTCYRSCTSDLWQA